MPGAAPGTVLRPRSDDRPRPRSGASWRNREPAVLAARLLLLHEGALATRLLPLDDVSLSADLARALVRASAPPRHG